MKPISLQLYTLRDRSKVDFPGVIRAVGEIGYCGVEPAGFYGLAPAELRRMVEDQGMAVSSSHGPWASPENLSEVIDTAAALGIELVSSGFGPEAFADRAAIGRTADQVNAMEETLSRAGLTLFIHNHFWEFERLDGSEHAPGAPGNAPGAPGNAPGAPGNAPGAPGNAPGAPGNAPGAPGNAPRAPGNAPGAPGLKYELFAELAPKVCFEIDTYWAANFGANDPAAMVKRFAARSPLLHIKDGPLVKEQPMVAVGKGKMPIRKVIEAADARVLKWLVVELDSCATDMLQAVRDSYDWLTREGLARGRR